MNTFAWNFLDLFITLISTALAKRIRQINRKIKIGVEYQVKRIWSKISILFNDVFKVETDCFWINLRNDYNMLVKLVINTDKLLGNLILISFENNIFFIVIQLYGCLK